MASVPSDGVVRVPPVVAVWPSVKTRYSTWATAATRAGISVTGGTAKGSTTSSSRALARTMRCAMVDSGTRNELAICAVVRPATARKVSATCDGLLSDRWHNRRLGPHDELVLRGERPRRLEPVSRARALRSRFGVQPGGAGFPSDPGGQLPNQVFPRINLYTTGTTTEYQGWAASAATARRPRA